MDVTLLAPLFLLLVLAIPLVWLGRQRDLRHALLRSAALLLLAIALARPVVATGSDAATVVFVLDRSASVPAAERERAIEWLRHAVTARPAGWAARVVEYSDAPSKGAWPGSRQVTDTTLSAALAVAEGMIPEHAGGALTLLSDGEAEDERWRAVVQRLSERGIPLNCVPLESRAGDVFPVRMAVDGALRVGHLARVVVTVAGAAERLDVVLEGPAGELAAARDLFSAGRLEVPLEFEPGSEGFLELKARVTAASDTLAENNVITNTFAVEPPYRVFYLGGRMRGGGGELGRLIGDGFAVTEDAAALSTADLVVLDDVPARALPPAAQQDVARRVTDDGIGLVMAGGAAAFGPGGWENTPIADLLPVEFRQKEERRDPSTTLVVIIDTSGSMGGTRVQLAKEVARLAIRRLLPHDKVGIVEFYGAKRWAAPIQPASNSIDIQRALNRLDAGGGTVIMPALEEAYYAMLNVQTRYKHVLVLTDGGVESGNFEALARKMAEKGITLSTVLVGPQAHSEFLVSLAQWGKGRFYSVPNRFNLPEILLKRPTSTRLPAYRQGNFTVAEKSGPAWLGDARVDEAGPLSGLVETRAKDGARVLLEDQAGRPLLASWGYGLGRTTAFMTEPTGPGTAEWRDWPGLGPLLAQTLTRTAGPPRPPFRFAVTRDDYLVTISATRLAPGAELPAATVAETGASTLPAEYSFLERAPGLFVAKACFAPTDELRIEAFACSAAGGDPRLVTRLVAPAFCDRSAELQVDPEQRLDLAKLAAVTGGRVLGDPLGKLPVARPENAAREITDLSPLFFVLALVLYLLDIVYRRLPRRPALAEVN